MHLRALRPARFFPALCLLTLLCVPLSYGQAERVSAEERAAFHRDPQWLALQPHLPDPQTGSAADLETAADVLRARRYPEDALDYYGYALARGGNVSELLNKMGVVRLELRQNDLARALFQRTVRANKKNPMAWNNLGVTEYATARYRDAIADYRKAIKLNAKAAVFHTNLGMAYFESGDMESARKEFSTSVRLDPHGADRGDGGGQTVHVVGSQNYGQLAFEMARVYARRYDGENTLLWLAKATEAGFDTRSEMSSDPALAAYAHDPRMLVVWKNARQMKSRSVAAAAPQSLGPAASLPLSD